MYSIAIVSDIHDWHSKQIESNLIKKNCEVFKIKYDELEANFNIKENFFLNRKLKKVDAVWLRFIKNGTLEEITTKLTFMHLLENNGVYVHNSPKTIEKTVDKVRTTGILTINNILTPNTKVTFKSPLKIRDKTNYLLKPIFGSQGKNIILINNLDKLYKTNAIGNVYYLQEFIGNINDKEFWDIRVLVSNHKPISVMKRTSKQIFTNAYQGASTEKLTFNKELSYLTRRVSKLFELGYGGIDIKVFKKKFYVLEVNSIPSWKAIQNIEDRDISEILVNDFLNNI